MLLQVYTGLTSSKCKNASWCKPTVQGCWDSCPLVHRHVATSNISPISRPNKKIHCWENTYTIQNKVKSSAVQERHQLKGQNILAGPKCCFWLLTGSFHSRYKDRSHPVSPSSSPTCKASRKNACYSYCNEYALIVNGKQQLR